MSAGDVAALRRLTRAEIEKLANALASGALKPPFPVGAVGYHVRDEVAADVSTALVQLQAAGSTTSGMAAWMRLLADERRSVQLAHDEVKLVWTGPEGPASLSWDTWVVVTDLFRSAQEEIVIASYALHDGRELLEELARRMTEIPALNVRMYLHVHREWDDETTSEAEVLRRFVDDFRKKQWPAGVRLPALYYDPRTLAREKSARASLHAKAIVVDRRRALVTSANLTEAAQRRNIEAGVLIENAEFAKAVLEQFESLRVEGILKAVPGLLEVV